jgi:hypothetical protein
MIEVIEDEILVRKHRLSCLYRRLFYLNEGLSTKSNYEKNEVKIKRIDTLFEISKEKKIISSKEDMFNLEFEKIKNK